ncbi:unnamed protein product [Boreogadus saida]
MGEDVRTGDCLPKTEVKKGMKKRKEDTKVSTKMVDEDTILTLIESKKPQKRSLQETCVALGVSDEGSITDLMNRLEELLNYKEVYPKLFLKLQNTGEMLTKVKTWLEEAMETSPPDSATETPSEESDPKRLRTEDQVPSLLDSLYDTVLLPSTSEAVEPEGIIEEELKRRWTSVLHHICGIHRWEEDRQERTCYHRDLTEEQQRRKKWLQTDSAAFKTRSDHVLNKNLLKDLNHMTLFQHTGCGTDRIAKVRVGCTQYRGK